MKDEGGRGDGAGSCGWWIRGEKKGACELWFLLLLGLLNPVAAQNVSLHLNSRHPHFSGLAVD